MSQPPQPTRQTSFTIVFAFTLLPLMMLFVAYSSAKRLGTSTATFEPLAYAIAVPALIGAILFSSRLSAQLDSLRFQTNMILCLGMAEFPSLIGFFLGGRADWVRYAPLVLGTVVVNALFIAPRVVAFWRDAAP